MTLAILLAVKRLGALVAFAPPVWLAGLLFVQWVTEWTSQGGPGYHAALTARPDTKSLTEFYLLSLAFLLVFTVGWWRGSGSGSRPPEPKHAGESQRQLPSLGVLLAAEVSLLVGVQVSTRLLGAFGLSFISFLNFSAYVLLPLAIWVKLLMRGTRKARIAAIVFQCFALALAVTTTWRYLAGSLVIGTLLTAAALSCATKGVTWRRALTAPCIAALVLSPLLIYLTSSMKTLRASGQLAPQNTGTFAEEFRLLGTSARVYEWTSTHGVQWAVSVQDAVSQSVPRVLSGTEIRPAYLAIVDSTATPGSGVATTFFAEVFTNAGLVGGVLVMLILGLACGRAQRVNADALTPFSILKGAAVVVLCLQIYQRGYLFASLFLILQTAALLYLLGRRSGAPEATASRRQRAPSRSEI